MRIVTIIPCGAIPLAGCLKFPEEGADRVGMQERRSEVRMMCADMVEVSWKDRQGKSRRATALLEDISASGVCLQLDIPLPRGAEVCWDCSRRKYNGYVQYCVYRETGFFIGVRMQPGSRWSKRAYQPQHMLDLRKLMAR
jgi:hypothetical protein